MLFLYQRISIVLAITLIFSSVVSARQCGKLRDPSTIATIVLHTIGGPACVRGLVEFAPIARREDDATFWRNVMRAAPEADAHFVIGRTGALAEGINITQIANHTVGANEFSIGIELVHRGDGVEPFEEAQILRLIQLIKELRLQFPKIKLSNITRHSDIDQRTCKCVGQTYRRRQDPGGNFPFDRILNAVRGPGESIISPTVSHLTGPAPERACVTHN
jgi:hypothetical protein